MLDNGASAWVYPGTGAAWGSGMIQKMSASINKTKDKKAGKGEPGEKPTAQNPERANSSDEDKPLSLRGSSRRSVSSPDVSEPQPGASGENKRARKRPKDGPKIRSVEVLPGTSRPGPRSSKEESWLDGLVCKIKSTPASPPPSSAAEMSAHRADGDEEITDGGVMSPRSVEKMSGPETIQLSSDSAASVKSAASGASKRSKGSKASTKNGKKARASDERARKRQRMPPLPPSDLSPSDGEGDDSVEEEANYAESEGSTRSRGRPVTTGEGILIEKRREATKKLRALQEQIKDAEEIADMGMNPKRRRRDIQLEEEVRNLPLRDVASEMFKAAQQIEQVAARSKNLKGGFVKILNNAARLVEVGTDALTVRSETAERDQPSETDRLRRKIKELEDELRLTKRERERERELGLMPPPPPPSKSAGGGRNLPSIGVAMEVEEDLGMAPIELGPPEDWPPVNRPHLRAREKTREGPQERRKAKDREGDRGRKLSQPPFPHKVLTPVRNRWGKLRSGGKNGCR